MAKVTEPLLSGEARGQFGKAMIHRRGGVVTKYFSPRNPNSAAQAAQREIFRRHYVTGLTQAQADLLYAAIIHQHDDLYSAINHQHKVKHIVQAFGNYGTVPASSTRYISFSIVGVNAAAAFFSLPMNVKILKLYARTNGTQPASGNLLFRLMVNSADVSMSVNVPAGSAANNYASTENALNVTSAQSLFIKVVNSATGTSTALLNCAIEYEIDSYFG